MRVWVRRRRCRCRWCWGYMATLWRRILPRRWLLPHRNCIWWMRDQAWAGRVWPRGRGHVRRRDRDATLRGWRRGTCLYTTGPRGRRSRNWGLTATRKHGIGYTLNWPGIRERRRDSRRFARRPAGCASLSDRWRIVPAAVLATLGWWGCNGWRSSPWGTEWQGRGYDLATVRLRGRLAVCIS